MQTPKIYKARDLENWDTHCQKLNGPWLPARPLSLSTLSLFWRFKLAYKVFVGRFDALDWEED